jgi:hypothetical protein
MLVIHFFGFGLLVTINVAGFILHRQYLNAADLQAKAVILKASRPIGLLSPLALGIMLITGIGNMHSIGVGLLDLGWLTAKIGVFAVAAISGVLMGITARKRGALVGQMAAGKAPENASALLSGYDKQIGLFYVVLPLLLVLIVCLAVYGRLGMQ